MEETLRQLGELLLGSVPTIALFVVAYFSYRFIVHGKLEQVLQDRYTRTEGAIEKARADIAASEAKTAEYEQRLREAKLAIYKAQENRRQQAIQARAQAIAEARERANAEVNAARIHLDKEVQAAKAELVPESERLAGEVISAVLRSVAIPAGGGQ